MSDTSQAVEEDLGTAANGENGEAFSLSSVFSVRSSQVGTGAHLSRYVIGQLRRIELARRTSFYRLAEVGMDGWNIFENEEGRAYGDHSSVVSAASCSNPSA